MPPAGGQSIPAAPACKGMNNATMTRALSRRYPLFSFHPQVVVNATVAELSRRLQQEAVFLLSFHAGAPAQPSARMCQLASNTAAVAAAASSVHLSNPLVWLLRLPSLASLHSYRRQQGRLP